MNRTFSHAVTIQGRVLWALMLREIHGKHGKSRLGYLWQLNKAAFGIAVFWMIRAFTGTPPPNGMPLPIFLLMGFIPWFIFSEIISQTMEAVRTNNALLTFPQIMPLDLYLSSALVVWVTEVFIIVIYLLLFHLLGYNTAIHNPVGLGAGLIGLGFFSFGTGLTLAAFSLYLPVLDKLVPMVMRVMFFASGIFFSPQAVGGSVGKFLLWNPMTNFIELSRDVFIHASPAVHIKTEYITILSFFLLATGLLLERYTRWKQEQP